MRAGVDQVKNVVRLAASDIFARHIPVADTRIQARIDLKQSKHRTRCDDRLDPSHQSSERERERQRGRERALHLE